MGISKSFPNIYSLSLNSLQNRHKLTKTNREACGVISPHSTLVSAPTCEISHGFKTNISHINQSHGSSNNPDTSSPSHQPGFADGHPHYSPEEANLVVAEENPQCAHPIHQTHNSNMRTVLGQCTSWEVSLLSPSQPLEVAPAAMSPHPTPVALLHIQSPRSNSYILCHVSCPAYHPPSQTNPRVHQQVPVRPMGWPFQNPGFQGCGLLKASGKHPSVLAAKSHCQPLHASLA